MLCSICGGDNFSFRHVLWPELISAWQLSESEARYIDQQQGCSCNGCGASLRIVALGKAIQHAHGVTSALNDFVKTPQAQTLRVLDINGAVSISSTLSKLPNYIRADFPEVDMHSLPYPDASFDLVYHSDTLEHVAQPILGLEECRRVLAPGGCLSFTVPTIVGRMSRGRAGLVESYHGNPLSSPDDLLVHTEFGADTWCFVMQAGFTRVCINQVRYPVATALTAWCDVITEAIR